jgi:hypothetical protein
MAIDANAGRIYISAGAPVNGNGLSDVWAYDIDINTYTWSVIP